jgi:type I restriction enzyme S subunit
MTTATQKIPSGYKQTEIGVIPADWDVKNLGDICEKITTGKLNANAMVEGGEYRFYTCAKDYYRINRYAFDTEALLVSGNGANVGYVHYYKGKFNAYQRTYVLSDFHADIQYIKLFLDKNLQERIRVEVNAGNTPYITMGTLTEMQLAVPASKIEQTAIANAISDISVLIKKFERLIEKKKNVKQGAMQELLTGKKRLPGFSGKWEVKKLGELLDYEQPTKYLVKDTEYRDNFNTPVLTAGKTFILGYTNEENGIFKDLPVIIFDDFTTATKFVDFPFKAKSSAMKMLKPRNKDINLRFVFEKMQMIDFKLGDHKRYWISEYQNIEIDIPKPDEQKAIANVLSDMDMEIEKLESQLTKYQNIKQGMMQTLLTGKIRLLTK